MRGGKYTSNSAFLRLKQDLTNPNPQMWDLAAYRILDEALAHFRTGSAWRIYPTYDFTHCLCDSFEGVTHSLCTSEFELSRESYEWLCEKVEVYKPTQREYVHQFCRIRAVTAAYIQLTRSEADNRQIRPSEYLWHRAL